MHTILSSVNLASRGTLQPFSPLVHALLRPVPAHPVTDYSSYNPSAIPSSRQTAKRRGMGMLSDLPKAVQRICGRGAVPPCTSTQVKPDLGLSLTQAGLKHLQTPLRALCDSSVHQTHTPTLKSVGSNQPRQTYASRDEVFMSSFCSHGAQLARVAKDSCKKHEKLSEGRMIHGPLRNGTCKINDAFPLPLSTADAGRHSEEATLIQN